MAASAILYKNDPGIEHLFYDMSTCFKGRSKCTSAVVCAQPLTASADFGSETFSAEPQSMMPAAILHTLLWPLLSFDLESSLVFFFFFFLNLPSK